MLVDFGEGRYFPEGIGRESVVDGAVVWEELGGTDREVGFEVGFNVGEEVGYKGGDQSFGSLQGIQIHCFKWVVWKRYHW